MPALQLSAYCRTPDQKTYRVLRVLGLGIGFRVYRIWDLKVICLGFWAEFRVKGLQLRVWGLGGLVFRFRVSNVGLGVLGFRMV